MKFLFLTSFIFFTFFSCKEKEKVVDPCTNGYLNIGETKVDCGGNCPPCPTIYAPSAQFVMNAAAYSFPNKSLTYLNSEYILNISNDSLEFQMNLGNVDSTMNYPILNTGSFATINGVMYNGKKDGICGVHFHNKVDKRMSAYFEIKFYRPGFLDTLIITSGHFSDLSY